MDPATETTVLLVLGSAFGVMFATMTTLLVVSIRVQHRESIKIRTEVGLQIEKAVEKVTSTLRGEFNERLDSRFGELMRVIEHNHQVSELQHKATQKRLDRLEAGFADLSDRLGGISDRLARVEGHLGIGLYPQKPAASDESDSDAA